MSAPDRSELLRSLAAGRPREAARIAVRLAQLGAWDDAVAATLFLAERAPAAERERAAAWLAVPVLGEQLGGDVTTAGPGEWDALFAALVESGRGGEAILGLELAADAALVALDSYLALLLLLVERSDGAAAWQIAALAVARFPRDARAWSALAFLALELGEHATARRACDTALALAPELPDALLTASLLAGDHLLAARLLDGATRAGVPQTIVEGYRRLRSA